MWRSRCASSAARPHAFAHSRRLPTLRFFSLRVVKLALYFVTNSGWPRLERWLVLPRVPAAKTASGRRKPTCGPIATFTSAIAGTGTGLAFSSRILGALVPLMSVRVAGMMPARFTGCEAG